MKQLAIILTAFLVLFAQNDAFAQKKGSKKKTTAPVAPVVEKVQLPYNSNDCLFPIDLKADIAYGPTSAPDGAGHVQEVMRDNKNPYLFEYEHNTVWYRFVVPYNGNLEIEITPVSVKDDYDFLVYRYTDVYFSNHIIQNKVKPVAANLSQLDSSALATIAQLAARSQQKAQRPAGANAQASGKGGSTTPTQTQTQRKSDNPQGPAIGMSTKEGKKRFVDKNSMDRFVSSLQVKKGEVYYIVLDNNSLAGDGHTIKVSIQVESFEPRLVFFDPVTKKNIDVDLLILEKNTDNRPIVKNSSFRGGKVKFVPEFEYTLYAKRNGFFSIYETFKGSDFAEDTMRRYVMNRTTKGATFNITDVYFENAEYVLMKESEPALQTYVAMMRNHPNVKFNIKGFVQTYGIDMEYDQRTSLKRAESVRDYFVAQGIPADRMTVSGMTRNEIKTAAAAMLNQKPGKKEVKIAIIITEVLPQ